MNRVLAVSAIIGLCLALIALLIIKPWRYEPESPRFVDRLPMSQIIGKTNILDLAKDLIPATYNNQIPFREFISPEFILSQGKINGLNLQRPVYFFGNHSMDELSDWGMMIHVSDSSKVLPGIKRFEKMTKVKDSTLFDQTIYICPEYNLTIAYGKDWLLITDRTSFAKYFNHVVHAKLNSIFPRWRKFIQEKLFKGKSAQASVVSKDLRTYGIESALFASSSDSTSLTLHARIANSDTIPFTLKPGGVRFEPATFTRRMINLNLNIDRLRTKKDHPIYLLLKRLAQKISFPLDDFLTTWDGCIAFRQGGIQTVVEPYIESELDDNFNVTEVVKYKQVKISGFALRMSMNNNQTSFINRLIGKGILTQNNNKFRMLYFPPMNMKSRPGSVNFYTSSFPPKTIEGSDQAILWDFNYTPVKFTLDSIQAKIAYGKINIGLRKIISDKIVSK